MGIWPTEFLEVKFEEINKSEYRISKLETNPKLEIPIFKTFCFKFPQYDLFLVLNFVFW